ncbi:hypothetical protein CC86DRAFT_82738 [Ophiobolus disseminans]|uniref:Telomerase reverse transcriptase n=1 Tax=Ophiobolus disseminans TaxID=1469910 RepID=A0A6A7AH35_9PLEO|nr:hypothetical protein CC86DRAFT_82738 [Ophiobolus disseminans]
MKRKTACHAGGGPRKKTRLANRSSQSDTATPSGPDHPVLRRFYPGVVTLRHYLLSKLPNSSKNRRRRISQLGYATPAQKDAATGDVDVDLGQLLDSTLVGYSPYTIPNTQEQAEKECSREIERFTQQRSQTVSGGTFKPGYFLQCEVVDFVIWLLFRRSASHKPSHLLCHGFQRAGGANPANNTDKDPTTSVPGLVARSPNSHVRALKEPVWCRLQALLGQGGDRIIIDMLLECALFCPVEGGTGNLCQLSGSPISDLKHDQKRKDDQANGEIDQVAKEVLPSQRSEQKSPGAITFVRSRMLYAKAALNAKGGVRFGMRHIHVLNRFPDRSDSDQSIHILRYIFPRQFGLHNVFTSKVNRRETAMPYKDYTLREMEIHRNMTRVLHDKATDTKEVQLSKSRVPKRLRGATMALIDRLRTLNHRCSYTELLRHYCPIKCLPLSSKPDWRKQPLESKSTTNSTPVHVDSGAVEDAIPNNQDAEQCFTDMACSTADVSAFCRATVAKVIPNGFWGDDNNKRIIMYWIDQFISLRRFESLTLHQVTQNVQPGSDHPVRTATLSSQSQTSKNARSCFWNSSIGCSTRS